MARKLRDEPVRGSPRPPRADFGHSCTAVLLGAGIRFIFGELDALTPPDCSGVTYPRGLWGRFFVKLRKVT